MSTSGISTVTWGIKSGNWFRLKLIPQVQFQPELFFNWLLQCSCRGTTEVGRGRGGEAGFAQWLEVSPGKNACGVNGIKFMKALTKISSSFFFLWSAHHMLWGIPRICRAHPKHRDKLCPERRGGFSISLYSVGILHLPCIASFFCVAAIIKNSWFCITFFCLKWNYFWVVANASREEALLPG